MIKNKEDKVDGPCNMLDSEEKYIRNFRL